MQFTEIGPFEIPDGSKNLEFLSVKVGGENVKFVPIAQALDRYFIEEIQAYLKTKGLGVFNLSLPFHYIPKNEDSKN